MTATVERKPMSEWDATMKPLARGGLWPAIRGAAARRIEADRGDPDQGISSSDINHTIYAATKRVDPALHRRSERFAWAVLHELEARVRFRITVRGDDPRVELRGFLDGGLLDLNELLRGDEALRAGDRLGC